MTLEPEWVLIVNEEGVIRNLERNLVATELAAPQLSMNGDVLRGTALYVKRTLLSLFSTALNTGFATFSEPKTAVNSRF